MLSSSSSSSSGGGGGDPNKAPKPLRLPYGGRYCCVPLCHNNTYRHVPLGISFHKFPKRDPERSKLWEEAVSRAARRRRVPGWRHKPNDVVCSEHFDFGTKTDEPGTWGYVPTRFVLPPKYESQQRTKRRKKGRFSAAPEETGSAAREERGIGDVFILSSLPLSHECEPMHTACFFQYP